VYLAAFPRAYFPPQAAALLAGLCCYEGYLPQGAPTSAAVSNLILKPFDEHMGKWCCERAVVYTRYCDDMTFSGDFDAAAVLRKARNFLFTIGFELNERKTRIIENSGRQTVTGVVVNEKPQVSRKYRDRLRQELYYLEKYGAASHLEKLDDPRFPPGQEKCYLTTLLGRVRYVLQINPQDAYFKEAIKRIRSALS
jgi:hypothetical protein